jgi:hypothetical protein
MVPSTAVRYGRAAFSFFFGFGGDRLGFVRHYLVVVAAGAR